MRISYNWIADYVQPGWSADELADRLTMSGLEVESVDQMGRDMTGVVVGHVLDVKQHPNADRLRVCSVDLGDGVPVQIVCGAPNVAGGQRVPVATVGTALHLPDRKDPDTLVPVTLKRSKIRGEESNGMICAEDELGLGDDHDGIMVLADDAPLGRPFAEYLASQGVAVSDQSIDIAITPNRPDAISHIGVARDVAALADVALSRPDVAVPEAGGDAASQVTVEILDPEGCNRYVGILVRGVTIGDSPAWMKSRLESAGLRPLNNVVDITNYVMMECGQPLHAFDFDLLADATIRVRRTNGPEKFTTLDDQERELPVGTLMITDGQRDVAIAGVMGGQNSEVSDSTTNVLIESAWFDPGDVRRASKKLGLQTDASYRFERGVDPTGQAWAAARAAELMRDLAGGTIVPGMVDAHPVRWQPSRVTLRRDRITLVLGVSVPDAEAQRLLNAIGFVTEATDDGWLVTVPPHRPDVEREIDLIEEVARLYGLDRIEEPSHGTVPNARLAPPKPLPLRIRVADRLVGLGYRELYTNSMMRLDRAEQFASAGLRGGEPVGAPVGTLNPISQEMAALRPSLLPGALQVLAHNLNHGQPGLQAFEFGHVFDRHDGGTILPGYREQEHLLVLVSGKDGLDAWSGPAAEASLFEAKGTVEGLLQSLGLGRRVRMNPEPTGSDLTHYHLNVTLDRKSIGTIGAVSPEVAGEFGIEGAVYFAEINFSALVAAIHSSRPVQYQEVSRFPVVERDIAVLVSGGTPVGDMLQAAQRAGGKLLRNARVFDVYEGKGIPDGHKSVAIGMAFGADRTLKDQEVDKAVSKVVKTLSNQFSAELRG
ncbi:MAG: phenylalanine--tRNA ligase subunit beta [Rhodothermales bacterium]|nr:phenylalanine--tRNA ligase subunit beta [Rhodothermales bacterium]MBO6780308.1 phenylalanine--tRNA ligase subunit beta [Rhodothermales bacterium]